MRATIERLLRRASVELDVLADRFSPAEEMPAGGAKAMDVINRLAVEAWERGIPDHGYAEYIGRSDAGRAALQWAKAKGFGVAITPAGEVVIPGAGL